MSKGPRLKADSELFSETESSLGEVCDNNFVHSYQTLADTMMSKEIPGYQWFRCVTPSWDNSARRKKWAHIYLGSTPEKYKAWLSGAIDITRVSLPGEERIVFINAWNEWAEGNHLEPDQRYGHAYLEATRLALEDSQVLADSDDASMRQLISCKYQLNVLQGRVARRDQEIEEMLNSTSWQATVPLRWVKQRLLDFKKYFSM